MVGWKKRVLILNKVKFVRAHKQEAYLSGGIDYIGSVFVSSMRDRFRKGVFNGWEVVGAELLSLHKVNGKRRFAFQTGSWWKRWREGDQPTARPPMTAILLGLGTTIDFKGGWEAKKSCEEFKDGIQTLKTNPFNNTAAVGSQWMCVSRSRLLFHVMTAAEERLKKKKKKKKKRKSKIGCDRWWKGEKSGWFCSLKLKQSHEIYFHFFE